MVQLRHRHHATEGRAPSWPGRSADDSISFADITALPEPEWASAAPIVFDASLLEPLPLTDWSARLADDWTHIADRFDNFAKAIEREFINFGFAAEYTSLALVSPVLAEVADLTKSRLPEWRRALAMHAEAELALYGIPEAGR